LARYTALILDDSIVQRRSRDISEHALLQRLPLALVVKEEKQTVFQNRAADGAAEDISH
jgi:hypothetical protein